MIALGVEKKHLCASPTKLRKEEVAKLSVSYRDVCVTLPAAWIFKALGNLPRWGKEGDRWGTRKVPACACIPASSS
jgi:hypothetical protein